MGNSACRMEKRHNRHQVIQTGEKHINSNSVLNPKNYRKQHERLWLFWLNEIRSVKNLSEEVRGGDSHPVSLYFLVQWLVSERHKTCQTTGLRAGGDLLICETSKSSKNSKQSLWQKVGDLEWIIQGHWVDPPPRSHQILVADRLTCQTCSWKHTHSFAL